MQAVKLPKNFAYSLVEHCLVPHFLLCYNMYIGIGLSFLFLQTAPVCYAHINLLIWCGCFYAATSIAYTMSVHLSPAAWLGIEWALFLCPWLGRTGVFIIIKQDSINLNYHKLYGLGKGSFEHGTDYKRRYGSKR